MAKPIHQLPSAAQLGSDGDYARIERIVEVPDGPIHVDFTYGTLDSNGDFVARVATSQHGTAISDRASFDAKNSTAETAPNVRADPASHLRDDILDHLDSEGLWPEQD